MLFDRKGCVLKATHLVCDPWTNEHCAEADSSRVSETARSRESCNNGPSRPQVRSEQSKKISASNSKLCYSLSGQMTSPGDNPECSQTMNGFIIWCFHIFQWMIQRPFTGVLSILQDGLSESYLNFSISISRERIPRSCSDSIQGCPRSGLLPGWRKGGRERVVQKIMSTLTMTATL